jgi:hypothetical protein
LDIKGNIVPFLCASQSGVHYGAELLIRQCFCVPRRAVGRGRPCISQFVVLLGFVGFVVLVVVLVGLVVVLVAIVEGSFVVFVVWLDHWHNVLRLRSEVGGRGNTKVYC